VNPILENPVTREEVLREMNLYPLWQLRHAAVGIVPELDKEQAFSVEAATGPALTDNLVAAAPARNAGIVQAVADYSSLGWQELKEQVRVCTACDLRAGCTQTVFGMGDEKADWLFVGSWPTEDDEAGGMPFAGQAGQLLDNMLAAIRLKRGSNVYLANVVKCCGSIKRGPKPAQIARCMPYLARQIQLLQPRVIVVLGHAAATAILGEDREWGTLSGRLHRYACADEAGSVHTIPLVITHHPAALLLSPQHKAQTWKDLCLARDAIK
jgi:uracil-DNA glycosylase